MRLLPIFPCINTNWQQPHLTCCLNKALLRPETKLPVTYQTAALVRTPILAWLNTFFWFYKGVQGKWGVQIQPFPTLLTKKSIQKLLVMIKRTHSFKPPRNNGINLSIEKLQCRVQALHCRVQCVTFNPLSSKGCGWSLELSRSRKNVLEAERITWDQRNTILDLGLEKINQMGQPSWQQTLLMAISAP